MKIDYLKFLEKLSSKGKQNIFVAIGIIGIFLIMISEMDFSSSAKTDTENIDLQAYKTQMEKEITDFLSEINGVGDVKVILTLKSGAENVYAQQENTTDDTEKRQEDGVETQKSTYENEFVLIGGSGNNQPLVQKTIQPEIQGVAVVCSGAGDISVVSAVTNSLSVILNLPTHKICVTQMR